MMENMLTNSIELIPTYDRSKNPKPMRFRPLSLQEAKTLSYGEELWTKLNSGKAGRVRVASQVKRWKRDPDRLEVTFKYGLYESVRMDGREIEERILVPV